MTILVVKDVEFPEVGVAVKLEMGDSFQMSAFIPHTSWVMLRDIERGRIPLLDELREAYIRGQIGAHHHR